MTEFILERVGETTYPLFSDMLFWRENGCERAPSDEPVPEDVRAELRDPNLYLYAAKADGRYVGWISLVYIPKVSKWKRGHVYVDELWTAPEYRRQGIAKALLAKADELAASLHATGVRLYVNVENPAAAILYRSCGFEENGQAFFMEK